MKCEICEKSKGEVSILIKTQNGKYLCNECINTYMYELQHAVGGGYHLDREMIPQPKEIKKYLDRFIFGQGQAKIALAVTIFNHFLQFYSGQTNINKSNVLLIGPTGVGKTLLIEKLSEIINVPYVIADATMMTEVGYCGADVDSILVELINKSNGNIEIAEKGIVYIDEFDKLAKPISSNASVNRDISGEGVQQGLLKMLDGAEISVDMRKYGGEGSVSVNTKNILFVCGGAFSQAKQDDIDTTQGLINYGLIPEIVGRFPIIVKLEELNANDLYNILIMTEGSIIEQKKKLFEKMGVELSFSESSIKEIAVLAEKKHVGARGLRNIVEDLLIPIQFYILDNSISKVEITEQYIKSRNIEHCFF